MVSPRRSRAPRKNSPNSEPRGCRCTVSIRHSTRSWEDRICNFAQESGRRKALPTATSTGAPSLVDSAVRLAGPVMSPPDIVIRPAAKSDVPALGRLGASLMRQHFEFDPLRFLRPGDKPEAGYAWFLGTQLSRDGPTTFVADHQGVV